MSQVDLQDQLNQIQSQLNALQQSVDLVAKNHAVINDLLYESGPILKEGLGLASKKLTEFEEKGYFDMGAALLGVIEHAAESYTADDIQEIGREVVSVIDTVRNLTQPDVLELANEATDVIHHADEIEPVGLFGAASSTRDPEIQRGMAIGLQILRVLGSAANHKGKRPARRTPPPSMASARKKAPTKTPATTTPVAAAPVASPSPLGAIFNEAGYLADPQSWTPELGAQIAAQNGVAELADAHWTIINFARKEFLDTGKSPNVRRVAKGSGFGTKEIYTYFPKKPGITIAKCAGIPKPAGCI